jgi:hypothetical protein
MAKFMLIKISVVAEITDADALREAALKEFDAADMTSDDYPDTGDWHASEEGREERRQVATQDWAALNQLVDPAKVRGLLGGVPGAKTDSIVIPAVSELEGSTKREALDALGKREGMPWLADLPESAD